MDIAVREPDPFHNHWGIRIRLLPDEDCSDVVREAMHLGKEFNVFHQGGHHLFDQRCGQYHYFEFWALSGDKDFRAETEEIIEKLKEVINA